MGFPTQTVPVVLTPAQQWAQQSADASRRTWSDFVNGVIDEHNRMWAGKDSDPQSVIDRATAMSTSAVGAFTLHAESVVYVVNSMPLMASVFGMAFGDDFNATIAALKIPDGWSFTPNDDGTVTLVAPTPAPAE